MKYLWMKALQDRRLEVLLDGGRILWQLLVPVNQTYLHESLYHPQHPWVGVLHQMNTKNVLQRNWIKSVWRAISRLWGIPERDPWMQIEEDNLVENLQCTTEAWWIFSITKILYQDDYSEDQISWWQKKCHMDMFQFSNNDILYCSELHEAFTENQCSRLKYIWNQALHYPWWSPERRKWFSNIYLHRSADKQTFW